MTFGRVIAVNSCLGAMLCRKEYTVIIMKRLNHSMLCGIIFSIVHVVWLPAVEGSLDRSQRDAIKIKNGTLTASLKEIPLFDILETLADKTGIRFELYADVDRKISAKYERVPLEEGLRRLLSPSSYIIIYRGKNSPLKKADIHKIIVYDNLRYDSGHRSKTPTVDRNRHKNQVPALNQTTEEADEGKSLEAYAERLNDTDPEIREEAISDMVDKYEDAALSYLEEALVQDGDTDVRSTAAEEIGELDSEAGISILSIGLSDPDEDVRETVVEALGEIGGKRALPALQLALRDESEDVRETAAELIEEIEKEDGED